MFMRYLVLLALAACGARDAFNLENSAAVAQYEAALDGCRGEAREAKSYLVYEVCERRVTAHFCRESEALRKGWRHCAEVGVE